MPTLEQTAALLARMNHSAAQALASGKKRAEKTAKLNELMEARLPESSRVKLREAMVFSVKSSDGKKDVYSADAKEGSRKAIETEDSRSYQALDDGDYKALNAAVGKIAALKEELLAVRGEDGKPLFTEADLMDELFSPLIREGLIVENLVIDKHSEVAAMLGASYDSYNQMLVDARKKKNQDAGKMEADLSNAGSRIDRLKALGGKVTSVADAKIGNLGGRVNLTTDEAKMLAELTVSSAMVGKAVFSLATPIGALSDAVGGVTATAKTAEDMLIGGVKAGVIGGAGVVASGIAAVGGGIESVGMGLGDHNRLPDLQRSARAAALLIDQGVANALSRRFPLATGAVDGRVAAAIDDNRIAELAQRANADRPQAALFIEVVAAALQKAVSSLGARDPASKPAFESVADGLARQYAQKVDAKALIAATHKASASSDNAFDALVDAAGPAADAAFSDPGFIAALPALQASFAVAAAANNEHLEAELAAASEETEAFERRLVLVDDGGDEMARQRSIAELIHQLERDRLILDMVIKVATPLMGAGATAGATMKAVAQTGTAVAGTGNAVLAAFSAAQLITQMAVEIIKIGMRGDLARKFGGDIDKSRKAGSRILPAVENFYNSKVAQEIFASITVALQAVQIAGTIASGVPEPITAASGALVASLGSMGQAANAYAQKVYTSVQLEKGWDATAEALNNPKNRRAGLDALHANGTLAVHAVAWAASEGDPLATQVLRSCGVNAATLADSATDQHALIDYLESRLYEDIKFKDGDAIGAGEGWVPQPLRFTLAGWCTLLIRAKEIATPALDPELYTPDVLSTFGMIERQPRLETIAGDLASYDAEVLRKWEGECGKLVSALKQFQPRTEDGQALPACERIKSFFVASADTRWETMKGLLNQRLAMPQAIPHEPEPTGRKRSGAVSAGSVAG